MKAFKELLLHANGSQSGRQARSTRAQKNNDELSLQLVLAGGYDERLEENR